MDWKHYFEQNRTRRIEIPWQLGIRVEPHLRRPLIRSLQRFQVGEQGDGLHLKRTVAATGDRQHAACIELFIAEEQEHARLLAQVLTHMNAPLLKRHWSDLCFVLLRRVAGLQLELMVLLTAELISRRYYRAIHDGTGDLVLRLVCTQILYDEVGHVDFHCQYLRSAFAPLPPLLQRALRACWRSFFAAVCAVVILDHRSLLQATGVPPAVFWRDCRRIFDEAMGQIFAPAAGLSGVALKQ